MARFAGSLNNMNFGGCLIIAESSSKKIFLDTKKTLFDLNLQVKIKHLHTPKYKGMTISQSMNKSFEKGIALIESDYAMLTCDDDIPLAATLDKCEKFLDHNNQYNGVNGELVWYDIRPDLKSNKIRKFLDHNRTVSLNPTFGLDKEKASERLEEYLDNFFHTMFTVVRTSTYKNIFFKNTNRISFPHFRADYNWMFGIALTGKIKHLKLPQVIRQRHEKNLGVKGPNHPFPSYLEGLITNDWGCDANIFVSNIAKLIKKIDGVSHDISIDQALEGFRRLSIIRLQKSGKITIIHRLKNYSKRLITTMSYRVPFFKKYKIYKKAKSTMVPFKV
jgi:glycosyltransferase domain-containing protein